MLDYLLVAGVALLASGLTLFSGFGLGTLLMPVLALLFPLPVAIAATAVVHLANNLFKLALVGRHANWYIIARFGVAAGIAAIAGAWSMGFLAGMPLVASYEFLGTERDIVALKLVIGLLIVTFALLELSPRISAMSFPARYLVPGGLLSGFFGGLSGNQGALRAAFLIRAGLSKHGFVGTSVVCAIIVDTIRILMYGFAFLAVGPASLYRDVAPMVAVAILSAFLGAWIGVRLLDKVTLRFLQLIVATMMIIIGIALATGIL